MLVAVFGILAVLVLEFGSFRSMLIVAGVIPLGVAGGLIALLVTGYTLSFTATIGLVALIGIQIKNSILLVDFSNQLREQGVALEEAIVRAGEIRFLPILLTSATAIGGLMPLAVQGSGLYSPLAIVIIGGLISSTLLGGIVTPVMYRLLPPKIEPHGTGAAGCGAGLRVADRDGEAEVATAASFTIPSLSPILFLRSRSAASRPSRSIVATTRGHSCSRKRCRSSVSSRPRAPDVTNMPRPRRFSTSPSSTSCW